MATSILSVIPACCSWSFSLVRLPVCSTLLVLNSLLASCYLSPQLSSCESPIVEFILGAISVDRFNARRLLIFLRLWIRARQLPICLFFYLGSGTLLPLSGFNELRLSFFFHLSLFWLVWSCPNIARYCGFVAEVELSSRVFITSVRSSGFHFYTECGGR